MKTYLYIAFIVATSLLIGCNGEQEPSVPMEGTGRIALHVSSDGMMQTRSEQKELTDAQKNQFTVSIYRGTALLVSKIFSQLTEEDLTVPSGSGYMVTAESCSLEEAEDGFGKIRLLGTSPSLTVTEGQTSTANVHCTPANAGVNVVTTDNFNALYSAYVMKVRLGERELTFTPQNASTIGYYNVPAEGATLSYSLTATRKAGGNPATLISTVQLQVGKITQLKLNTTSKGTITLGITYDDEFHTEHIDINIDTTEEGGDDNDGDNDDDDTEIPMDATQETNTQLVKPRK